MTIRKSLFALPTLLVTSCFFLLVSFTVSAEVSILMKTSEGDIHLSLDDKKAPVTVANFVQYAESGFYNGTIFHRVIRNFMIQGGGFDESMTQKKTEKPIFNEGSNSLTNDFGTIAMARTSNPNSATSQFFINHKNNTFLNAKGKNAGYAVFGKVTKGLDVLEIIAASPTSAKGGHQNVPLKPIMIKEMLVIKPKAPAEKSSKTGDKNNSSMPTAPAATESVSKHPVSKKANSAGLRSEKLKSEKSQ